MFKFLARRDEAPVFKVREIRGFNHNLFGTNINPEVVYQFYDPSLTYNADKDGIIGHIVIADTTLSNGGMAKGGTAMYPGCDLATTIKKADVMARKQIPCNPFGLPPRYKFWGGAKGGIDFAKFSDGSREAELVWRGVVQAAWDSAIVPHLYVFGLDVGTNEYAAAVAVDQVRSPHVITGKPSELGGVEYDRQGFAGRGATIVGERLAQFKSFSLRNSKTTVAIQGFGAVGLGIAHGLIQDFSYGEMPRIVAVSDVSKDNHKPLVLYDERGLDLQKLYRLKKETGDIFAYIKTHSSASILVPGQELYLNADVLFLASSQTQTITENNVADIRYKVIVQGSNLGVSSIAEKKLWAMGILTLPDYMTNYASSASVYIEHARAMGKGDLEMSAVEEAWEYINWLMQHNTDFLLKIVKSTWLDPHSVSETICAYEFEKARAQNKQKK